MDTECTLLHGAVGMATDWRLTQQALGRAEIASRSVDLWRFLDCCPKSFEDFSHALNAEIHGSLPKYPKRVLLGYSMGARLALHVALQQPELWDAVILISAHPGLELESERQARLSSDAEWASRWLNQPWQEVQAAWNSQSVLGGEFSRSEDSQASLMQRRKEIARSFMDWSLGAQVPLWDKLPDFHQPTLWITGANDEKFSRLAERSTTLMPHSQHLIVPNSGHRVPWENSTVFHQALISFIHAL